MHHEHISDKPAHWEPVHSPAEQAIPVSAAGAALIGLMVATLYACQILQLIP